MTTIRIKRVYEAPADSDGFRLLVDRLWPRGLTREQARIDAWLKSVSPSNELRRRFHHDPAQWDDFRASYFAELEAAVGDAARFFALNEAFHLRLLELADNRWRLQMVQDLRKVMKLHRRHSLQKAGRLQASLAEHRALMQAIAARDGAAAAACMQAHFQSGLEAAS